MKLKMLAASLVVASFVCCDADGQLLSRLTNRCGNGCGTSCCDAAPVCNTGCNSGGCGISISLDINFQLPRLLRRRGCGGGGYVSTCNSPCAPSCDTGCGGGGGCNLLGRLRNRGGGGCCGGCDTGCDVGCGSPCENTGCPSTSSCGGCDSGCGYDVGCNSGCGFGSRIRGRFQRRGFLTRLCSGGCGGCDAGCGTVVDSGCGGCSAPVSNCGGCDMGCGGGCDMDCGGCDSGCGSSGPGLLQRLRDCRCKRATARANRVCNSGCDTGCGGCDSGCGTGSVVSSGCGTGCGGSISTYPTEAATPVQSQAQPIMDAAPVQTDAVPVPATAPASQPSALDAGSLRNPVVDPSAFIFRGKNNFRNN